MRTFCDASSDGRCYCICSRNRYHTVLIGKPLYTHGGCINACDGSGRTEVANASDEFITSSGDWARGAVSDYQGGTHHEGKKGFFEFMQLTAAKYNDRPDGIEASDAIAKTRKLRYRNDPFFLNLRFCKPHSAIGSALEGLNTATGRRAEVRDHILSCHGESTTVRTAKHRLALYRCGIDVPADGEHCTVEESRMRCQRVLSTRNLLFIARLKPCFHKADA